MDFSTNNTSRLSLTTSQVVKSHRWLVAAVLDSTALERVWAWEVKLTLGTRISDMEGLVDPEEHKCFGLT